MYKRQEELCAEGYLVKMQGRGTFVSKPRIHRKFTSGRNTASFTETCKENGIDVYKRQDLYELSDYVSDTLVPTLQRADGVSSVSSTGLVDQMVQVRCV